MTHPQPLTAEELQHLAEVREVCRTINSAGWQHLLTQIKRFVDEAHEDMFGAVYASAEVKAAFQMRWQQREAMLRGIQKYIADCEDEKTLLLETTRRDNSVPVYAEQD